MKERTVRLELITLDPRLQSREINEEIVRDYAEDMGRGDIFPPVRILFDGKTFWLVDGWHRTKGAKVAKLSELSAIVEEGTFEQAFDISLTVNREHGLRRSHANVQQQIRRALLTPWWLERSDRWIGKHIGCSHHTVEAERARLEAVGQIAQLETLITEEGKRYPRQRKTEENRLVIADTYTITEWVAIEEKDRRRIVKAAADQEGKGFNQQDTDNIEWAQWSWNPVTGCKHNCPYCYARDIAERFKGPSFPHGFEPTFHPKRLLSPNRVLVPERAEREIGFKNVFVCSMADLFGRWVPEEWIQSVLVAIKKMPQWNFLFLTKFPVRLSEFEFPDNAWIGTSVDCQARVKNAEIAMSRVRASVKWLSCEPLIEPLQFENLSAFQWMVIGGASSSSATPAWRPPRAWVESLRTQAWNAGCQIYEKDNLLRRWRQYPGHDDQPPLEAPTMFHYLKRTQTADEQIEEQPIEVSK